MGVNSWNHMQFLHHKVRHMIRRGYLKKTYYDKKILQARINTGVENENDRLEWLHPVGYLGRVKPGPKVEIFTMDVGADPSRRVVLHVIGDRETHPKIDEGESIHYTPGDPKKFIRIRKGQKDDGSGDANANYGENKKPGGIEINGDNVPISTKTKKGITTEADEDITTKSKKSIIQEAGEGMTRKAKSHTFEGDVNIKGNLRISGEGFKPSNGEWAAGAPTGMALTEEQEEYLRRKREAVARTQSFMLQQEQRNQDIEARIDTLQRAMQEQIDAMKAAQSNQNAEVNARLDDLEARVAALEGH